MMSFGIFEKFLAIFILIPDFIAAEKDWCLVNAIIGSRNCRYIFNMGLYPVPEQANCGGENCLYPLHFCAESQRLWSPQFPSEAARACIELSKECSDAIGKFLENSRDCRARNNNRMSFANFGSVPPRPIELSSSSHEFKTVASSASAEIPSTRTVNLDVLRNLLARSLPKSFVIHEIDEHGNPLKDPLLRVDEISTEEEGSSPEHSDQRRREPNLKAIPSGYNTNPIKPSAGVRSQTLTYPSTGSRNAPARPAVPIYGSHPSPTPPAPAPPPPGTRPSMPGWGSGQTYATQAPATAPKPPSVQPPSTPYAPPGGNVAAPNPTPSTAQKPAQNAGNYKITQELIDSLLRQGVILASKDALPGLLRSHHLQPLGPSTPLSVPFHSHPMPNAPDMNAESSHKTQRSTGYSAAPPVPKRAQPTVYPTNQGGPAQSYGTPAQAQPGSYKPPGQRPVGPPVPQTYPKTPAGPSSTRPNSPTADYATSRSTGQQPAINNGYGWELHKPSTRPNSPAGPPSTAPRQPSSWSGNAPYPNRAPTHTASYGPAQRNTGYTANPTPSASYSAPAANFPSMSPPSSFPRSPGPSSPTSSISAPGRVSGPPTGRVGPPGGIVQTAVVHHHGGSVRPPAIQIRSPGNNARPPGLQVRPPAFELRSASRKEFEGEPDWEEERAVDRSLNNRILTNIDALEQRIVALIERNRKQQETFSRLSSPGLSTGSRPLVSFTTPSLRPPPSQQSTEDLDFACVVDAIFSERQCSSYIFDQGLVPINRFKNCGGQNCVFPGQFCSDSKRNGRRCVNIDGPCSKAIENYIFENGVHCFGKGKGGDERPVIEFGRIRTGHRKVLPAINDDCIVRGMIGDRMCASSIFEQGVFPAGNGSSCGGAECQFPPQFCAESFLQTFPGQQCIDLDLICMKSVLEYISKQEVSSCAAVHARGGHQRAAGNLIQLTPSTIKPLERCYDPTSSKQGEECHGFCKRTRISRLKRHETLCFCQHNKYGTKCSISVEINDPLEGQKWAEILTDTKMDGVGDEESSLRGVYAARSVGNCKSICESFNQQGKDEVLCSAVVFHQEEGEGICELHNKKPVPECHAWLVDATGFTTAYIDSIGGDKLSCQ